MLVADLGALCLALRHAVSWAVKYDVKVHSVDAWTGTREARHKDKMIYVGGCLTHPLPTRSFVDYNPNRLCTAYDCARAIERNAATREMCHVDRVM